MAPGSIAHYRITSKLGEGGMGAVYRAKDTKLNRDVAIKILPDSFAQDPDRLSRFAREAQVLASLNHPNIAAIYGVEERALVMELVQGRTIAGPLSPQECMPIVNQLIDALEYAHEKGIVHRDLKPDNIKLTPDGRVKVLDFGLAKAMGGQTPAEDPTSSPTLTMQSTVAGVIMGTAGYMSPEQARGQEVDKRADIWAFGVIVYELLTGRQLFQGPTVSDSLAAVLTREPDLRDVPPRFQKLLQYCLTRDVRQRLRDISGARLLLEDTPAAAAAPRSSALPWAVAAVLAVASAAGWWVASRPEPVRPVMHLEIGVPDATPFPNDNNGNTMAISSDGTRVAFVLKRGEFTHLYTRLLSQPQLSELAGSEGGRSPFFSPDGKWVGFSANGKLKKVPVSGGGAITLCDAPNLRGASWSESGEIIASLNITGPLFHIPSAGGAPVPFTTLLSERSQRWPQVLPGGRAVVFTANAAPNSYDQDEIAVYSFDTGKRTTVYRGGFFGRYLPGGYLTWVHGTTLFAAPFDLKTLAVRGGAVPMLEDVRRSGNVGADVEFSPAGILLYQTGGALHVAMQWLDESGKTTPLPGPADVYYQPRLSPDGKRLAYQVTAGSRVDIWVRDFERDVASRIPLSEEGGHSPIWTPDGRYIIFGRSQGVSSGRNLYYVRSDGSGSAQVLGASNSPVASSFSPDGKQLVYTEYGDSGGDIYIAPVEGGGETLRLGKPELLVGTPAYEASGMVSPDGRWLAYSSNESGVNEIYVRPFPRGDGRWQVSQEGGVLPRWSPNGRELLYRNGARRLMRVDYTVKGNSFTPAKPRAWSNIEIADMGNSYTYDISPDGKRLLVVTPERAANPRPDTRVNVMLNFFDEVRQRVAEGSK